MASKLDLYGQQIVIALMAYLGQVVFGLMAVWSTPIIPKLEENPELLGNPTNFEVSLLVSVIFVGSLLGSIPMSIVANRIGRKPVLLIGSVITPVSYLGLALSSNIYVSIFLRTTIGLGASIAMIINIVYLGEIASTEIRGIILGLIGTFNCVGFIITYVAGPYLSYAGLNYLNMAIGLIYCAGMVYIPESPLYLVKQGRDEEARAILLRLKRKEDAENLAELREAESEVGKAKFSNMFTVKSNRKALFITGSLFTFQQLSGYGPLLLYTTTFFQAAGSSIAPHVATMIMGVVQLLSSLITPLFIERYGRKFLLLISTMTSCLSLAILGTYFYLDHFGNPVIEQIQWLPLVLTICYFVGFGCGFGPVPNALVGEMFELSLRSSGTAVVIVISWVIGFAISLSFGTVISYIGFHVAIVFFSVMSGCTFLFTVFFVPETKGKTLLEVQKMLSK